MLENDIGGIGQGVLVAVAEVGDVAADNGDVALPFGGLVASRGVFDIIDHNGILGVFLVISMLQDHY